MLHAPQQGCSPQFQPEPHDHRYPITINQNYVAGSILFIAECVAPFSNATQQPQDFIYRLTSSDHEYFAVNSTSGVISLTLNAQDLPGGGSFTAILYCTCVHSNGAATVELSVRYQVENEHVPRFTHGQTLDVWVREDHVEQLGSIITQLNVTDDDLKPCDIVTFTIVSGNDNGTFRISSQSGILESNWKLDYDSQQYYNLTIQATNTECGQRRYSTQTQVYIFIEDIDDEHPTFENHMHTFTFNELHQPENFVRLACVDLDTPGAQLVYDEDYSLDEYPFTVNHRTGYVSATQNLDYEQQTLYHLVFTCYNVLNSAIKDRAIVKVVVNPINEYFPEVRPRFAYIRFSYTSPVGTLLASAENFSGSLFHLDVIDHDHGLQHSKIYFKFTAMNSYYDYFHLDATSGNLTLARQFDFDVCSSSRTVGDIVLRIIVCDSLEDTNRLQLCPIIVIYVSIISPSCTLTFLMDNYTVYVSESARIGTDLLEVHCHIPGIGSHRNNTSFQQMIQLFSPNSKLSRTLRMEGNNVILQEMLDYESVEQFTVYLRCSNDDGQESIASVLVKVLPENDNAPYFEKPLYPFKITADQFNSLPATIGYISAMDEDEGIANNLTYTIAHNVDFDYSGDVLVQEYFMLNTTENGTVTVIIIKFPREEVSVFDVFVSDGISSTQSSVLIHYTGGHTATPYSSLSVDQCGVICVALLIILVTFMLIIFITLAVVVCLCFNNKKNNKDGSVPLTNIVELQENKLLTVEYSNLQRENLQQSKVLDTQS